MVRTEILQDGRTHTWSDAKRYIIRDDGVKYEDAIDRIQHTYTESDEEIPDPYEPDIEDKAEAYDILTGVSE